MAIFLMGLETVIDSYRQRLLHRCIEDITMATFNFVLVDETIKSQESKDDAEESIKEICDICGKQFNARKKSNATQIDPYYRYY